MASDSARGDPERQPAADALRIGDPGHAQREQRELPAVMVDPLGHEHAVGRSGEEHREERERIGAADRSAAARSARARRAAADRAAAARSRPPSAPQPAPPRNGRSARISPAIGRSTSRDQWILAPNGGFIRYWRKIEPALPVKQRRGPASSAYCRRCRGSRKKRMLAPLLEDEPGADRQPDEHDDHFQWRSTMSSAALVPIARSLPCSIFRAVAARLQTASSRAWPRD